MYKSWLFCSFMWKDIINCLFSLSLTQLYVCFSFVFCCTNCLFFVCLFFLLLCKTSFFLSFFQTVFFFPVSVPACLSVSCLSVSFLCLSSISCTCPQSQVPSLVFCHVFTWPVWRGRLYKLWKSTLWVCVCISGVFPFLLLYNVQLQHFEDFECILGYIRVSVIHQTDMHYRI